MGVMSAPKPKKDKAPDPSTLALETIEVPRAWIREHGWPDSYVDLQSLVDVGEPGFKRSERRRGEIAMDSYRELDVAFFRAGQHGEAFLYAQAWRGPA